VVAVLVGLGAWLHPFSAADSTDSEPADTPAVVVTTPATTAPTTPPSLTPATAGVDPTATPTDCGTIVDYTKRMECVSRARRDAAEDVIKDFN